MANYYTSFCTKLEMSEAAFQYLAALDAAVLAVEEGEDPAEETSPEIVDIAEQIHGERERSSGCSMTYGEGFVVIKDEDCPSLDVLADILHATMKAFEIKSPFVIQYADWCDKHLVDGFGGGVMVVTADRIHGMSTYEWASGFVAKLAGEISPVQDGPAALGVVIGGGTVPVSKI